MATWPPPANLKDLQQFLGLANYYNQFVAKFADLAAPMTELLSSKVPFVWGERQQAAFERVKQALCDAPVLRLPDWSRDFVV